MGFKPGTNINESIYDLNEREENREGESEDKKA